VAAAPRPRHAVAAVPRPAAAAPDPEGERRQCGGGGSQAGGRNSINSTHGGGGSSIRSSGGGSPIQRASEAGPLCGQAAASPQPRGGGTSKAGEQAMPVDVRVATATHEARCSSERRHGRREMRAAMFARDIL
jgi:hypothetical protein